MITTKIHLRKDAVKNDGTAPLYLQVIIDRKVRIYHTGSFIPPELWDGRHVKTKYKLAIEINNLLDNFKAKADNIIIQLRKEEKTINFDTFEQQFIYKDLNHDFYKFVMDYITTYRKNYTPGTFKMMKGEVTKLMKFSPQLLISQIDYNFIKSYEAYMLNDLNNSLNTVAKSLKKIKEFYNIAIRKGLTKGDPFANYKFKTTPTNRSFLDVKELRVLEELLEKNQLKPYLINTLKAFIFASYTGLRFEDMKDLEYKDVKHDYILLVQHKTGFQVTIPLIDKARKMIDTSKDDGKLFLVYSNQKCNQYLKEIMEIAHIRKPVSFHTARHTFATVSLNIGIPIEVVSKILGHHDLRTTQIYAKLFERTKFTEMDKWNKM